MCHVQESEEGLAEQVGWTLGLGRVIRQNPAVKPPCGDRQWGATEDSRARVWFARRQVGVR